MMEIIIGISELEEKILRTHLIDPEKWVKEAVRNQIHYCANRVFEEVTGKMSRKVKMTDKLTEITEFMLKERKPEDNRPVWATKKKDK